MDERGGWPGVCCRRLESDACDTLLSVDLERRFNEISSASGALLRKSVQSLRHGIETSSAATYASPPCVATPSTARTHSMASVSALEDRARASLKVGVATGESAAFNVRCRGIAGSTFPSLAVSIQFTDSL